ncbi:MAG: hypothetical protein WCY84_00190 [Candidatus Cloacimonadaceae bacterium]
MKVYKSSILSLPVKSCQECPNRVAKRFKSGERYYSEWVCAAIEDTSYDKALNKLVARHRFPSVMEQLKEGGYHRDCPLADLEGER